jgi:hypothetical protein
MKKQILSSIIAITTIFCSNLGYNQTLGLGILNSFEAYSGAGAVSNSGSLTGDVGTSIGIISGCVLPNFIGNVYNADGVTNQCRYDLFRTYIHLNDLFVTHPGTHAPAFGGGETITPGVYSTGGAGSVGGNLTLDGGGNPNAYFVIKFNGALTLGAGSTVTLTNGTQPCNVFWIAEGAISVAANSVVKGTLFAHIGAVSLGVGVNLEGRMLSLEGAITVGAGAVAIAPACTSTIPVFCEWECNPASEVDVLGVLSDFALYTSFGAVANTSTSGIEGNIGSNGGIISGYASSSVIGSFHSADALTAQAKIDIDSAYASLMALPNTVTGHAPAFGSGETVNPGVYYIGAAGSLAGTITLDGQNNPGAIFVFKFAGAFSVAAASKIILTNGARRCNIFWIGGAGVATGAVTIGAASVLKGTFLSHGGACNSGANVFLAGRQLSTAGAVNTYSGVIYNNPVCVTSTSLLESVIVATDDTTAPVDGILGGTNVINVLTNDTLNGVSVNISDVNLTTITPNANLTLNPDGSIDVAPNTPVGTYTLVYQICETLDPTNCQSATVTVLVNCGQSAEPNTACYETATFNSNTCNWDVTGTQSAEPNTACYETATFNSNTCNWDITGTQSAEPNTACYETAIFNSNTCNWDVTGTQSAEPNTACYETATFNSNTCNWDVTGTQSAEPNTACYETATFNSNTCSWDVTGTQSAEPNTACYETATFNSNTCNWDVTGTQSAEPNTACYETAIFNSNTCSWDVTGTQSAEPNTACYETATFNSNTCNWDVTGTQSAEPNTTCYTTAIFNSNTCNWDVIDSPVPAPSTACYETATFNLNTCNWNITGSQAPEPNTADYETATFNSSTCSWDVTGTDFDEPLNDLENEINIYPNPTKGLIIIDLGNIEGPTNYALYTFEGSIIQQENNITDKTIRIDLSNERSGIYLLKINQQTTVNLYRIVKQ